MKVLGPFVLLVSTVYALRAAPILLLSHKLVPGLKQEIRQPNTATQDPVLVTNMVKKLVTECSSDIYVIVNVPGLTNSDMLQRKSHVWKHLQNYLHMASSVVGLPWVEGTLDLPFLEEYIIRTCKAESLRSVSDEEDGGHYIDTRKRVMRVDVDRLPDDKEQRDQALFKVDDLLRRILRKSPSPHYTILITSDEVSPVHPIPESALAKMPQLFEIFNDIVNDPKREQEVERNNYLYNEVEPYWNTDHDPTELYLRRKKADEVHFFTDEMWQKNEKLVMTVALMIGSLAFFETLSFGRSIKKGKQVKHKTG